MKSYFEFVSRFPALLREGGKLPFGSESIPHRPELRANAPVALIFSPHPDDECIIGGLALRLRKYEGFRIVNIAVTLGSNRARQAERWRELTGACRYLGFDLRGMGPNGLEKINLSGREKEKENWSLAVAATSAILSEYKPAAIFFPHAEDWNSSHIGVHHLVREAMVACGPDFSCHTIETEFWGQNDSPNLGVESSEEDLGELVTALSFHVGEITRNPYHLLLPAWMMDNVRRAAELVGGQGKGAPPMAFATLYQIRKWEKGQFVPCFPAGRFLPASESCQSILL